MSRGRYPAGPEIIDSTGFDWLRKLFDADSATSMAAASGLLPEASATLMAMGTITTVAPTLPITRLNMMVSRPSAACKPQTGIHGPTRSSACCATQFAAPVESIAQPRGIRQAISHTVFQFTAA